MDKNSNNENILLLHMYDKDYTYNLESAEDLKGLRHLIGV